MALSELILNKGEVVVTLSESTTDMVTAEGGSALTFGYIQKVNDLSSYSVGNNVLVDIKDAVQFMIISGTVFYLVKEHNIRLKENPITPP